MSAPRFLAVTGEPEPLRGWLSRLVPERERPLRLNRVFDAPDLVVFASPETPLVTLTDDGGIVVGTLFTSGETAKAVTALPAAAGRAAVASGGRSLLEAFWGRYVAFLRHQGAVSALRDPSGGVPAYHRDAEGLTLYASDGPLFLALPFPPAAADPEFLRQWLTFPFLRTARTGVAGTSELLPGSVRSTGRGPARLEQAWTPWSAAVPDRQLPSFGPAAEQLRRTIIRTAAAQVRGRAGAVLELSGGLDSSVVAAALAAEGIRLPGLNFVTRTADGDERSYARSVATALELELAHVGEDERPLAFDPPPRGTLRPALSPALQPLHRALAAFAEANGVSAFVTGAGGDNLFCYLTTAAPILDAWRDAGPAEALGSTLADVAAINGCTIWTAARFALRKAVRPRRIWPREARFLTREAIAERNDPHPWLEAPRGARAGKREHVATLLRAQHFLEPASPSGVDLLHPLLNQPLMELCLSIPTWLWTQGGNNRAVARHAFRDLLPPDILRRRTKGRLESMCARAFEASRRPLAELLLDGELARAGFLDVPAVAAYLTGSGPAPDDDYFRLFELASLELWLRSFGA